MFLSIDELIKFKTEKAIVNLVTMFPIQATKLKLMMLKKLQKKKM